MPNCEHSELIPEKHLELVEDVLREQDSQYCTWQNQKKSKFLKLAPMFILKGAQKKTPHIGIHPYDASNLNYRSRVTDIPEYSMLLICNLQMTAGVKFCKNAN